MFFDEESAKFPYIFNELAEWTINLDQPSNVTPNYNQVAQTLLKCRSQSMTNKWIHAELDLGDRTTSNKSHILFNSLWSFVVPKLKYLTWLLSMLPTPSPELLNYVYLRHHNCPWQVGYLSNTTVQGEAICLVATYWMELMNLPGKFQTVLTTTTKQTESNSLLCSDLDMSSLLNNSADWSTLNQPKASGNAVAGLSSGSKTRKWYLSYVDPFPQWRLVSFWPLVNDQSNQSCSYLIAIGYSNGSIDVIDLSIDENVKVDVAAKRSHMFIQPPFGSMEGSNEKLLLPLVGLAFVDVSHLVVCHFRGHVDLWHLDWEAKNFPARRMTRIYPCGLNILLDAVYEPALSTVTLSGLSAHGPSPLSKPNRLMHHKFGLTCFQLSTSAPHFVCLDPSNKRDKLAERRGLQVAFDYSKHLVTLIAFKSLNLARLLRPKAQTVDACDAIARMFPYHNTNEDYLIAALQCSGSYSVWTVPSMNLLYMIANPHTQLYPNGDIDPTVAVVKKPFRLAWWTKDACSFPSNNLQLVVLNETGNLDVLDYHKSISSCVSDEAQSGFQIKLRVITPSDTSCRIDFATHSLLSNFNELILIVSSDVSSSSSVYSRSIRCIRLKSTSTVGLFDHLLHTCAFDKALKFAKTLDLPIELVYKHMWIIQSRHFRSIIHFKHLIQTTLHRVSDDYPIWVMNQCLNYIPLYYVADLSSRVCELFDALTFILQLGLDIASQFDLDTVSVVKQRFHSHLEQLECIQQLLHLEVKHFNSQTSNFALLDDESGTVSIERILHAIVQFRQANGMLDMANHFVQSNQFWGFRALLNKYGHLVGNHRIRIASSLSETVSPHRYMNIVFDSVDRQEVALWNARDDAMFNFVKLFIKWLIGRSVQIDRVTGFVNYALFFVQLGIKLVNKYRLEGEFASDDLEQIDQCMVPLIKINRDFIEFSRIIYRKYLHVNPKTNMELDSSIESISNLVQFEFKNYRKLNSEHKVNLLIQTHCLLSSSLSCQPNSLTLFVFDQLLPHIVDNGIADPQNLINHCLLEIANHTSSLQGHLTLLKNVRDLNVIGLDKFLQNLDQQPMKLACQTDQSSCDDDVSLDLNNLFEFVAHEQRKQYANYTSVLDLNCLTAALLHVLVHYDPLTIDRPSQLTYIQDNCQLVTFIQTHLHSALTPTDAKLVDFMSRCCSSIRPLVDLWFHVDSNHHAVGGRGLHKLHTIKHLVRASRETKHFQYFVDSWIQVIIRFAQGRRKEHLNCQDEVINQLNKLISEFYTLTHSLFADQPASSWFKPGLQYALFASGNVDIIRLFDRFQLDWTTVRLEPTSHTNANWDIQWTTCWLHAVRTYLNTWIPALTSKPQCTLLHYRDACVEQHNDDILQVAFRIVAKSHFGLCQHAFDVEQALFDVCRYLAVVGLLVDRRTEFVYVPHKLRRFWTARNTFECVRLCLFKSTIVACLRHLPTRHELIDCLQSSNWIDNISGDFYSSPCHVKHSVIQVALSLMDLKLQYAWFKLIKLFLANLIDDGFGGVWQECALFAGYPHNTWSLWTQLHALFHIECPAGKDIRLDSASDLDVDWSLSLDVEVFRMKLIRHALVHCPPCHLHNLHQFSMHCLARLERLKWNMKQIKQDDRLVHFAPLLKSILMTSSASSTCRPVKEHVGQQAAELNYEVSLFYKSIFDVDNQSLTQDALDERSVDEQQLWMSFLSPTSTVSSANVWLNTVCHILKRDTQLALSFMRFICLVKSWFTVNQLVDLLIFQGDLSSSLSSSIEWNFTNRIQLILIITKLSNRGDAITFDWLMNTCRDHESIAKRIQYALKECLVERLRKSYPSVDMSRFVCDDAYCKDTVLGMCSEANPQLGIHLALSFELDLHEALFSHFEYVILEGSSVEYTNRVMDILTSNLTIEEIATRVECNIFPYLNDLNSVQMLLTSLGKSVVVNRIKVEDHEKIVELLKSDRHTRSLFDRQMNYSNFINHLFTPIESTKAVHNHPLYIYLNDRHLTQVFGHALAYVRQHADNLADDVLDLDSLHVMCFLAKTSSSEAFDASVGQLDVLFEMVGVIRLVECLQLILYEFGGQLDVDRRRELLDRAHRFVSSYPKNSSISDEELNDLQTQLSLYLEQFGRVSKFVQKETSQLADNPDLAQFSSDLYRLKPGDHEASCDFITKLVYTYTASKKNLLDDFNSDTFSNIEQCLNDIIKLVSDYVEVLNVDMKTSYCIVANVLSKTLSTFVPSPFRTALSQLSQYPLDTSVLISNIAQSITQNPQLNISTQMLIVLLMNPVVRKLMSAHLIKLADQSESELIEGIGRALDDLWIDVHHVITMTDRWMDVIGLKSCLTECNVSEFDQWEQFKSYTDIMSAAIELVMIFKHDDEHCKNIQELWYLWLRNIWNFIVSKNEFNCDLDSFLIHEWTHYGKVSIEYTQGAYRLLTEILVDPTSSLVTIKFKAVLLSLCINQSDHSMCSAILDFLLTHYKTSQCAALFDHLDHETCIYTLISNPDHRIWLDTCLTGLNNQSDSLHDLCSNLVYQFIQSACEFLKTNQSQSIRTCLGSYLIRLLRSHGLWLEACRLWTLVYLVSPINMPIDYLIKMVKQV